jgi:hypothetical protein
MEATLLEVTRPNNKQHSPNHITAIGAYQDYQRQCVSIYADRGDEIVWQSVPPPPE